MSSADDKKAPEGEITQVTVTGTRAQKPLPQKPLSEWAPEDIQDAIESGRMQLPQQKPIDLEDTITPENLEKYVAGEITWAELMGMTMEEAYGIAEFGFKLYQEAKYHEAKDLFEALVLANPYDAYFHSTLGAVYQQLDMTDEAMIEYNLAIELDDEDLNAHVNRAELLLQQGKFEPALKDLQRALELDPDARESAGQRAKALAVATAQALETLPKVAEKLGLNKK